MSAGMPRTEPLKDLVEIKSGGTPSKQCSEYWGGDIPWVSAKDMKSSYLDDAEDHLTALGAENGTKVANDGEILILVRGMTLHNDVPICMLNKPMAFNQDVKSLSPKNIDSRFLFHALKAAKPELLRRVDAAGHGTGRLGAEQLKSLPIPRFGHQQELDIAATLAALDDKIEVNCKTAATLEEMAQALYRSWFVDFDPVHAKAAGRAPAHMDAATAALFPDSFGEDGLPEGWEMRALSDFMTFTGGSQPPASEFTKEPAPDHIRLLQIRDFYTDSHLTYVPKTKKLRLVAEDDICIGRYGSGTGQRKDSLGRMCRGLSGAINVALVRVDPNFDCREFLAAFIGSGRFQDAVSGGSARAVQAGFRKSDLETIEITRANVEVHHAFEVFGTLVWHKTKSLRDENQTLAALRDALLPRLMSGELRVGEAKEQVEAVA